MFLIFATIAQSRLCRAYQEAYDDDDRARQLALGTMMLRKHRAKDMVDAAYNRFSWNDDADLPDWFADDEKRHYRPQVPLPPALVEQMKNKFMSLATKPIKKVAEARARKRKRATQRLANAKKKATAMAANPGVSHHIQSRLTVRTTRLVKMTPCPRPRKRRQLDLRVCLSAKVRR